MPIIPSYSMKTPWFTVSTIIDTFWLTVTPLKIVYDFIDGTTTIYSTLVTSLSITALSSREVPLSTQS